MVKYLDCRLIRQLRVNTFTERVKRQMVKAFRISYADYYMLYSNIAILNGPLNPGLNHAFWVEKSGIEAWGKSLAWGWNVLTIGVSCRAFQLQTFQPQEASTPDFWTLYLGMKCYCWKLHRWVHGWKMSVFVHAQGIKTVHVVVECPLSWSMYFDSIKKCPFSSKYN